MEEQEWNDLFFLYRYHQLEDFFLKTASFVILPVFDRRKILLVQGLMKVFTLSHVTMVFYRCFKGVTQIGDIKADSELIPLVLKTTIIVLKSSQSNCKYWEMTPAQILVFPYRHCQAFQHFLRFSVVGGLCDRPENKQRLLCYCVFCRGWIAQNFLEQNLKSRLKQKWDVI